MSDTISKTVVEARISKVKLNKFLQETKGIISLLLVLLLVPFYSVAAILVEVERYQSAVSGMDETIDSSLMSVLAQYDSFLQDRFGLLAIGQSESASAGNGFTGQKSIQSEFEKYLNKQDTTDSRSFLRTMTDAQGVYPLADLDVLKAQILEYSNMTVPSMLVAELGDGGLQKIIDDFQKSVPFMGIFDIASDGADIAGKEIDIQSKYKDAKNKVKKLGEKTGKYDETYNDFNTALEELKETVKNVPSRDASIEELDAYDEKYHAALKKAQDAQKAYQTSLQDEIKSTENLNSDLKTIAEKRNSIKDDYAKLGKDVLIKDLNESKQIQKTDEKGNKTTETLDEQLKNAQERRDEAKKRYESTHNQNLDKALADELAEAEKNLTNLKDEKAELDNVKDIANAAADGADSSQTNAIMKDYNTETCGAAVSSLTKEMEELKKLNLEDITPENVDDITKMQEMLHQTDMSKLSDFNNFSNLLNESQDLVDGANSSVTSWSRLAELGSTLMDLSVMYDPKLQSVINTQYYADNFGGLPSEKNKNRDAYPLDSKYEESDSRLAEQNLKKIELALSVLEQENQGSDGLTTAGELSSGQAEDANTKLGKLIKNMKFFIDMAKQSVDLVSNLKNIASTSGEKVLLASYLSYCTSNRVNYASAKSLTGAEIKSSGGLAKEVANSQNNLAAWVQANEETNYSLCGAETEYLLVGNKSEKFNQRVIFGTILGIRLMADITPVKKNAESQLLCTGLAGAMSVVMPYSIAKAIAGTFLTALEAYADTVLICNGATDIPAIKAAKDVFFCGSGISNLIESLQSLSISEEKKKKLQKKATDFEAGVALNGAVKSDGESAKGFDFEELKKKEEKSKGTSLCIDYQKYLFLLMMIWSEKALLSRYGDIIQMEETQRNLVNNASMSEKISGTYPAFDLDKAYTTLRAEVKGDFVKVLPVPTMSKKSIWKTDRIMYRGY